LWFDTRPRGQRSDLSRVRRSYFVSTLILRRLVGIAEQKQAA
jgi:hypothetical protein